MNCQWEGDEAGYCVRPASQRVIQYSLRTGYIADDRVFCTIHLDSATYTPSGYETRITHLPKGV